jgi:hypothetical protein
MECRGCISPTGGPDGAWKVKAKFAEMFPWVNSNHDLKKRQPISKAHKNGDSQPKGIKPILNSYLCVLCSFAWLLVILPLFKGILINLCFLLLSVLVNSFTNPWFPKSMTIFIELFWLCKYHMLFLSFPYLRHKKTSTILCNRLDVHIAT